MTFGDLVLPGSGHGRGLEAATETVAVSITPARFAPVA